MQRGKCLLLSCSTGQRRNPPAVLVGKHPFRGDNIEASSEKSSMPGQEEGLSDGVLLVCPPQCWGHCFCKDWQGQDPLPACWALSGQQKGCGRALRTWSGCFTCSERHCRWCSSLLLLLGVSGGAGEDADGSKSGPAKDSVEQNGAVGLLPLCTVTVCVVTVKGFSW